MAHSDGLTFDKKLEDILEPIGVTVDEVYQNL